MGRFEKFALVDGSWTAEISGDRWLLIEIRDSDIATITFSPAPEGRGVFYLGTEPRVYFDDSSASAIVDIDGASSAFKRWARDTLGVMVDSTAVRNEMSAVDDETPRDAFVEDAVVRLLRLMDLDLPPALRSASAAGDPHPHSFIERLAKRASGWVGETAHLTADIRANPPFLSIVPRRPGAASVLTVGANPIEIQVERSNRIIEIDLTDQTEQIVDEILLAIIDGRVTEIRAPGRSELCVDLAGGRVVLETGLEPGWAALLPLPGWRLWGARTSFASYLPRDIQRAAAHAVESGWDERAQRGETLARDLATDEIDDEVIRLLLDPVDTGVTSRTAAALLARRDVIGVRHVVRASAVANDSQIDWLYDELRIAHRDSHIEPFIREALVRIAGGADPIEAAEAVEVLRWLGPA